MRGAAQVQTHEERTIYRALSILRNRMVENGVSLSSPAEVRRYLWLRLSQEERELFMVLWLDAQNRLIDAEVAAIGTLTQTSVHPRELVKSGLRHNAAAAILAHNHPSGRPDPSSADRALTRVIRVAFELVDIRTLDHFIIAGEHALSFAEHGLMGDVPAELAESKRTTARPRRGRKRRKVAKR